MKKLIYLIVTILLFASCVTSRGNYKTTPEIVRTIDRSDYAINGDVVAKITAPKVWILFIPIGGCSDQGLYNMTYKRAVKKYKNTTGLLNERSQYKKVTIPLILFTFVFKKIEVSGSSYHIKSDSELTEKPAN